jgi:hypothetical protein
MKMPLSDFAANLTVQQWCSLSKMRKVETTNETENGWERDRKRDRGIWLKEKMR